MVKVSFDVPEETKIKRRWVFIVLSVLLLVSVAMYAAGSPFNSDVSLAFVISFSVALIIKIVDWVEGSKLVEN